MGGEVYAIRKNLHDIKHMNDDFKNYYNNFHNNYNNYNYGGFASHADDKVNFDKVKDLFGTDIKDAKNKSDVERAYKAAARKYHPDLNKSEGAAEKMKSVNVVMDRIRNSSWFQKLATDEEYIMEKIAEYMEMIYDCAIEKTAENKEHHDRVKKLMKGEMNYNAAPTPKTWRERAKQPENFKEGTKVFTHLLTDIDDKANDIAYSTHTSGAGRQNQTLIGEKDYDDIPSHHLKDETPEEYLERKKKNIKESAKYKHRWNKVGLGTLAAGTLGGAALGSALARNEAPVLGGIAGGLNGAIISGTAALGAVVHGHRKAQKEYLSKLKPHELELLEKVKNKDADEVSQDVYKAHKITGENVYSY
jgi:curved DNA-binding protein CbpA